MSRSSSPFANTVLVVEDNPLLRLDAVEMIEEAGFRVLAAAGADEALACLAACGDIVALFTDIDMPGSMDGLALAHLVRQRSPGVRILVTSGGVRVRSADLPDDATFLSKPYLPSSLLRHLGEQPAGLRLCA